MPIPYEFMDITLNLTLERIYMRIDEPTVLQTLHQEILGIRKKLLTEYIESKQVEKKEFETYIEPQQKGQDETGQWLYGRN